MAKKQINKRCPFQMECERTKCMFVNCELGCNYYCDNAAEDNVIPDQEERRRLENERVEREREERMLAEMPSEDEVTLFSRDVAEIAQKVNDIKRETYEACALGAVRIGGLLKEAKKKLPHGQWESWLAQNVDYSISTAQRLMKLHDTYGEQLIAGADDVVTDAIASMLPSKALLLAQLEPEQRREYVETHDTESESTRQMREEIQKLKAEKEKLSADLDAETLKLRCVEDDLEKEKNASHEALRTAATQAEDAKAKAAEIEELQKQIKALKEKQKAAKAAAEQAKAEAKPDPALEAEVERLRKEAEVTEERIRTMEEEYRRKLERAANPNMQAFLFSVQTWQKSSAELLQYYAAVKTEDTASAEKFAEAIKQQLGAIEQSL